MANFGLSKPWIAKYDPETGKYSDAFKCGKAINTSVTPSYATGVLYADNEESERVSEFVNAAVVLGTDSLPIKAGEMLFGHKISESGEETSNAGDTGSYVGYGFTACTVKNNVKKYRACLLLKVKFNEGEESYNTKGESITFGTPNLNGTASAIAGGDWRKKSEEFATEVEADKWIQKALGVTEE